MLAMAFAVCVRPWWDRVEPRDGRSSPVADISQNRRGAAAPLLRHWLRPRCRYAVPGTGRAIIKSVW